CDASMFCALLASAEDNRSNASKPNRAALLSLFVFTVFMKFHIVNGLSPGVFVPPRTPVLHWGVHIWDGPTLKAERILKLGRYFAFLGVEVVTAGEILNPALVEDNEQIVSSLERPAHPALPSQISREVVVLN